MSQLHNAVRSLEESRSEIAKDLTIAKELIAALEAQLAKKVPDDTSKPLLEEALYSLAAEKSANDLLLDRVALLQANEQRLTKALDHVSELEAELRVANKSLLDLSLHNSKQSAELQDLSGQLSAAAGRLLQSEADKAAVEKELLEAQRSVDALGKEKSSLQQELTRSEASREATARDLAALIEKGTEQQATILAVKGELSAASDRIDKLSKELAAADALVAERGFEIEMLKKDLSHADEVSVLKNAEMSRLLKECLRALAAEKSANDLLQESRQGNGDLTALQAEKDSQSETLRDAEALLGALREELLKSRHANELTSKDLVQCQSELARSEEAKTQSEKRLDALEAERRAEQDATASKLFDLAASLSESEVARSGLDAELSSARAKIELLQSDLQKALDAVAHAQRDVADKSRSLDEALHALAFEKLANDLLREEKSDSHARLASQSSELQQLRDKLEGLKLELNDSRRDNDLVAAALSQSRSDADKSEACRLTAESELSQTRTKLSVLEADLRVRQAERGLIEKELVAAAARQNHIEAEMASTRAELSDAIAQLSESKLASEKVYDDAI